METIPSVMHFAYSISYFTKLHLWVVLDFNDVLSLN